MATKTKKVTKTTAKRAASKAPTKTVRKTTENTATQKVVVHRELKYVYPRGMTDTLKRKAYRAKVRNHLTRLNAQINKAEGKAKAKLEQELKAYEKEHLVGA